MTAQLYVELYDWYRMPPSVHKVLIHGALVIKYSLLPIGFLSEEAQESIEIKTIKDTANTTQESPHE